MVLSPLGTTPSLRQLPVWNWEFLSGVIASHTWGARVILAQSTASWLCTDANFRGHSGYPVVWCNNTITPFSSTVSTDVASISVQLTIYFWVLLLKFLLVCVWYIFVPMSVLVEPVLYWLNLVSITNFPKSSGHNFTHFCEYSIYFLPLKFCF